MNRRHATILLSCLALVMTTACTSVPVVSKNGNTYYVQPRMDTNGVFHRMLITQDIATGVRAAEAGLKKLDVKVKDSRHDKIIGQVEGEMADGKEVRITVQKNMNATEMRIYLVNKTRATQIFKAIADKLR